MVTITTPAPDEVARHTLRQLEHAWNAGDGPGFAGAYAVDATFVTIRGDYAVGRPAIADGHAAIFATTHAGSVNRMELLGSRELGDGIVVTVSRNTLTAPRGPLRGTHAALSTSVLVRTAGRWRIAATHNTLVGGL